jgi:hypothetical protein
MRIQLNGKSAKLAPMVSISVDKHPSVCGTCKIGREDEWSDALKRHLVHGFYGYSPFVLTALGQTRQLKQVELAISDESLKPLESFRLRERNE